MSEQFGGHSMTGALRKVLVCEPRSAGWFEADRTSKWRELGYIHPPQAKAAQAEHEAMTNLLQASGADVYRQPPSPKITLDGVYPHDAGFVTDQGTLLLRMGKPSRRAEPRLQAEALREAGVPVFAEVQAPGMIEAGDMVWLDPETVLIGRGYRTNQSGIEQVEKYLEPLGVRVMSAPLPHGQGPDFCLHLMSLLSLLDEKTLVVDSPWIAVETLDLLRDRGFRFIEIAGDERESLATNVLSLGRGRLLALEENRRTNSRLERAGFKVSTFSGTELCLNGSGGPTCLTRPLLRD